MNVYYVCVIESVMILKVNWNEQDADRTVPNY